MLRTHRWHLLSLLTILLASFLAACGSTTTSGNNDLTGTISYWAYQASPDGAQALQQLKTQFESKHPGAHVNIVPIPKDDFGTKLSTAMATGTPPDASVADQIQVAQFEHDGNIAEMPSGLVNASDFSTVPFNTNIVNGKVYGLPQGQTCIALFYNKDLLPTPPTNWSDLIADAKKTYDPAKKIAAAYFPTTGGYAGWMFPAFVAQAGGTMLDEQNKKVTFADKPGVDALTLWKQLYSYSPADITGGKNAFQTGHVAMLISGPWEIPGFADFPDLHWGVSLLPKDVQNGTNLGGENGVVYQKSKHQRLAWEWLKFLSTDGNVTLNDKVSNNFPVYKNDASPDSAWAKEIPARATFLQQLDYAQPRPTNPNWNKINDEVVGKAIEKALINNGDPQVTLEDAAAQAKTILGW
ncbi:MAG TPA: ABC transporter substrate-binding protein [Ktedonobacteraceae bacterium]|nr:ABC transporter substrate-binding protein [Ktedonobacteraceae bacterium]